MRRFCDFEGPASREERTAILDRARGLKMARSAHAYVRGNTVKFYEWLAASPKVDALPVGPPVWICGDCHVGNLGPLADADGKVAIQIRDLDQTVIGNPAHDLIRLGLSLATAARGSDLPGVTTARMIEEMVRGYELALRQPGDEEGVPEPDAVRMVRRQALGRRWRHLAKERIEDVKPTIPLGKRFWQLLDEEREALGDLFQGENVHRLVQALTCEADDAKVKLVDAAYWMKGCSSLGTMRFAALVDIDDGDGKSKHALLDLKQGVKAAAPAAKGAVMPKDNAERVVAGATALSPNLGERMAAAKLLGKPMVVRELMPQDLKLEIDQFTREEAVIAARYLAYVVGHAHARQMDESTRDHWRRELVRRRPAELDAPNWLWSSVVELSASHEAGYLEHCRRYAMATAL
ncbi:MAG: DUF2252 family protein [Caulobacteraceae bacterium]